MIFNACRNFDFRFLKLDFDSCLSEKFIYANFLINKMNRTIFKKLSYIGACINEGQTKKGVKLGPQTLRDSGLFNVLKNVYGV